MLKFLIGTALSTMIMSSSAYMAWSGQAWANESQLSLAGEEKAQISNTVSFATQFSIFTPRPQSKKRTLDYSIWDEALEKVVIDLGPSTRLRADSARPSIGTRFVRGHKSAYRLEGSRFTFEFITDDYAQGLTDYRMDLQDVATKYDITTFPKEEQLAFWLNLYNVATIEKIADSYPVQRPDSIKIKIKDQKYTLDEAPFITISGVTLSLRDIRENIVYKNWDNPLVIYGFFRGEVGGPSLQKYAFTGADVNLMLTQNADDFVNSLRGFNLGFSTRNVSEIYQEAAPYFFPNFETDLEKHLKLYANEEVGAEVSKPLPFRIERYDNMIADLSGGRRLGSSGAPTGGSSLSPEILRLLREAQEKREFLIRNDKLKERKGYVIIEDLVPEEDKEAPSP